MLEDREESFLDLGKLVVSSVFLGTLSTNWYCVFAFGDIEERIEKFESYSGREKTEYLVDLSDERAKR